MIINSIKLKNFRQLKDVELDFSADPKKKITVILGDNTFGKTTLVRSFVWCLYGENEFDDPVLLNYDVGTYMKVGDIAEVKATMEISHDGFNYQITTKQQYKKGSNGTIYPVTKEPITSILMTDIKSGQSNPLTSEYAKEAIEGILSSDLKNYFFFDGEKNRIESISDYKNLKDAVSDLLGLKNLELLNEYYDPSRSESVCSKLESKKTSYDETAAQNVRSDLEEEKEKLNQAIKDKEDSSREKNILNRQLAEKEQILNDNKDLEKDQNRKKELMPFISSGKSRRENDFQSLISSFSQSNQFLKCMFAKNYVDNHFNTELSNSTFNKSQTLSNISEKAVDELIARGYCLCGAPIKSGTDAYNHLLASKEHMEPRNYGKYASDFVDEEESNLSHSNGYLETITDCVKTLGDNIEKLELAENELKAIDKRIAGRVDVGQIGADISNLRFQIKQKEYTIEHLDGIAIPHSRTKIEKLTKDLSKYDEKNKENEFVNLCLDYAHDIFYESCKKIKSEKTKIKKDLEKEADDIFKKMYHGKNRSITIDDNYRVKTVIDGRVILDGSGGLGTVKNFAFVAGLMKLAKLRQCTTDDIDDTEVRDEDFPLVMDAPFSNTDPTHITNICATLPEYCNQIIIVVMEKDFDKAANMISDNIGKRYQIYKKSETYTDIKEVS